MRTCVLLLLVVVIINSTFPSPSSSSISFLSLSMYTGLEQQPLTYTLEVIVLSMFKKCGEKAHESVSLSGLMG